MIVRMGSLFSGIGGLELGLERGIRAAGHAVEVVYQVERSAFCRCILARHWPMAQRYDDVRSVGAAVLPPVDLLCGGFPCQDVSSAGRGAGLDGARSGLWWEFLRIIGETRPRWVVVENVASGASRWLPAVRRSLGSLGYASVPVGIAACEVGARHRRERVFVVAGDAADAGREGLAFRERQSGDTRPLAEAPALGDAGAVVPWEGLPPRPWMVRGVHGLSGGVDGPWKRAGWTPARLRAARIHALGNAVVPAQVEPVGRLIGMVLAGSGRAAE